MKLKTFFTVFEGLSFGKKNKNLIKYSGHKLLVFSIGITLVDVHLNGLNSSHLLILVGGLLVILIDCIIFLSPFLDITRMSMSTIYFLAQLE